MNQGHLDPKAKEEKEDLMDLECQEKRVQLVILVHKGNLVRLVLKEMMVHLVLKDKVDKMGKEE